MFNNRTLWDRFRGFAAAISCSVLLGVALTPRAAADVADKKTIVTFNAPVEVPGKVLPGWHLRIQSSGHRWVPQCCPDL